MRQREFLPGIGHGVSILGAMALIAGCGGSGPAAPVTPPQAPLFTVGGTVVGLKGSGLQLLNNGDNSTPVSVAGAFSFTRTAVTGAPYAVTISAQPTSPAQVCSVANGTGTIDGRNVTNVTISCVDAATVTGSLKFFSYSAFETYLIWDSAEDLRQFRFELYVDHVRMGCCGAWNTAANAPAAVLLKKYVNHVGVNLTPYTTGQHLYEVRVIDPLTLNILARDSILGGTVVENKLLNGDASQQAAGAWTIDGGSIGTRQYSNAGSLLFNLPVSPYERTRATGYFSTEGMADRKVIMRQRVTVAFPGVTDGTTALYWGGSFGLSSGGRSEMQIQLVGENLDGTPLIINAAPIGASSNGARLFPDFKYGVLPKGIHWVDVTVTLDATSAGEAFADNLFVSVLPWPY